MAAIELGTFTRFAIETFARSPDSLVCFDEAALGHFSASAQLCFRVCQVLDNAEENGMARIDAVEILEAFVTFLGNESLDSLETRP